MVSDSEKESLDFFKCFQCSCKEGEVCFVSFSSEDDRYGVNKSSLTLEEITEQEEMLIEENANGIFSHLLPEWFIFLMFFSILEIKY